MRLQLSAHGHHTEMVTACCWTPTNELITCSDDQTVCKWSLNGELQGEVCKVDSYITSLFWFKPVGKQPADTFAASCCDGTIRFISGAGREEKRVQAAKHGAVISLRGNQDGQSFVSASEDGSVKVWSRSGNLRSTLAQISDPVYAVCWGPDSDQVLFSGGEFLNIQTLQSGKKKMRWKAHKGVVTAADWNSISDLVVSCGEDCVYKVWDSYGRQLFQSAPFDNVLTSIAWSPSGEAFAVGSYNMMRLCDRTGWSHCRELTSSGSVMQIDWTSDGTLLAGAGGNGSVLFGQLVDRRLQWGNIEAVLADPHKVRVTDVVDETVEELDFRDRVLEMSLGFGSLVVCTATQCHIYSATNWNTPHIFDVRDPVRLIVQSATHFLTIDAVKGVQAYTYEGHRKGNPRAAGLRPEHLSRRTVALCGDAIAILDQSDLKAVRLFDVETGRPFSNNIAHQLEIVSISLSQSSLGKGGAADRKLAFIDRNRDLYLAPIAPTVAQRPVKLHAQVDTAVWNDAADVLLTIADGKVTTWFYPSAAYVDGDLLRLATEHKDGGEFGKLPEITSFYGTRAQVRRADGAVTQTAVSPTPAMLCEFVGGGKWEEAVRLCRFVKSDALWAALAAMALQGRHLETAEIALAALKEVDKLHYVLFVQSIPSEEGRQAELALWRRSPDEAEQILLQAQPPLTYRAVKMNIRLFRWERALELAMESRTHVDTVLGYRQKHLDAFKKRETLAVFKEQLAELGGKIDWDEIAAKKAAEKAAEAERAGGGTGKAVEAAGGDDEAEGKESHK